MKPQISLLLLLFIFFTSCNKERLEYNPQIGVSSSVDQLLNTKSFFDVSTDAFILSEEEYDKLFINKIDSTYTFHQDKIFSNLSNYQFIGYTYFTDTPERYFMGKIIDLKTDENTVIFTLSDASYEDLYDDYLINTALPNGVLTPRSECKANIEEISNSLLMDVNDLLELLSDDLTANIQAQFTESIFEDYAIEIKLVGKVLGCADYFNNPNSFGVVVNDFELKNFGIEVKFAPPSVDLASIQDDLTKGKIEDFNSLVEEIQEVVESYFGLGNKSLLCIDAPIFGTRVGFCGGLDLGFEGEFIQDNTLTLNTIEPLKLEVSFDKSSFTPFYRINGVVSADLYRSLKYSGNSYLGGKTEMLIELLGGITFGDLGRKGELGLLLGRKSTFGLDGQVGKYSSNNGASGNYLNGCGSMVVTDHAYLYANSDTISSYFNNLLGIEIPNTIQIGEWPVYNVAQDPQFKSQDPSIIYNKICFPDNCKNINEGSSYFKINSIIGNEINFGYLVTNTVQTGFFNIILEYPSASQVIVENGVYNGGISNSAIIESNKILDALLTQDQSNISVVIQDLNNDCIKTLPAVFYETTCQQDIFEDPRTNLKLRAYNLDLDADRLSSCYSNDDPIWVFQDDTYAALYSFAAGYQSFDYMSYQNCECFADRLSAEDGDHNYSIPSYGEMESFIDQTSGFNYAMTVGNKYCSNFAQTGYIILSQNGLCNNSWNSNPIVAASTKYCINNSENAYFFVDNPDDPLNDYLFMHSPSGEKDLKRVAKGVLAPCRLKVN